MSALRAAPEPGAGAGRETFRFPGSLFLIAGPCVLEEESLNLEIARQVKDVSDRVGVPAVFKASFDKANRTSAGSPRGPGLDRGLELLAAVRDATGLPLLTDIHEPRQAQEVSEVVDVLQIPAFLCRQTDLLLAAAESGRSVNIKKGQWMAPELMAHSVNKVRAAGGRDIAVTERGTAFGYGRWVVDMRSFPIMGSGCRCPIVFDATHSVQLPGGAEDASGGEPAYIETLARAAVAAGADGLFVEVHPRPAEAPSDGANMLPLEQLEPLLAGLVRLRAALAVRT